MKKLNIGVVGYGLMGRTHTNAYRQAPRFFDLEYEPVLKAICGRDDARGKAFAKNWGYESNETDWRKLIERDDIDAIDIASPNNTHHDIAIAAAEAGKMVLCEKPLGRNPEESQQMVDAVEKAGVPNFVWYNYRFVPAVTMAKTSSIVANSAASSTTVPISSKTGPLMPSSLRVAKACGDSMLMPLAVASPVTY